MQMRKILFLLSIISLIFLSSCQTNNLGEESPYGEAVNQLEGVSIELTEDIYQPEGDQFELRVVNESEEQISYGVAYALEYYDETVWYEVEPDEEISFIMIAYLLDAVEEATEEINLEYYEPLEVGRYRLIRQIAGEALAAEFEIVDK